MKLLTVCLAFTLLLTGCSKQPQVAVNNQAARSPIPELTTTPTPASSPIVEATPSATTSTAADTSRPVEVTYLGVTADKESFRYKVKINTAKPMNQADLDIKFMNESGKVLEERTFAWQNIVKSVRKPIEQGKTYEVEDYLAEGAIRAEIKLLRVFYEDGTGWSSKER